MSIESLIEQTIAKLQIPKELQEDATQEGWVAHLEGESIIAHLSKWQRNQRRYRENHIFFSELEEEQKKKLGIT